MKMIKVAKTNDNHYWVIFDIVPKVTFEKIGADFVGSYEQDGQVMLSEYLYRNSWGGAFGGKTLHLEMKDGRVEEIKDYWFDGGSYEKHGEFISIGSSTLKELQDCCVYSGVNINKYMFEKMLNEYLKHDKVYTYEEVEEWVKMQYEWFDVIVHNKKLPYMMNVKGELCERETKKRIPGHYYKRYFTKSIKGKSFSFILFKFEYKEKDTLIKLEAKYYDVLKDTLPFVSKKLKEYCGVKEEE